MAQLALDKTADAFRNLHMERLSATNKWQETLNLIAIKFGVSCHLLVANSLSI